MTKKVCPPRSTPCSDAPRRPPSRKGNRLPPMFTAEEEEIPIHPDEDIFAVRVRPVDRLEQLCDRMAALVSRGESLYIDLTERDPAN